MLNYIIKSNTYNEPCDLYTSYYEANNSKGIVIISHGMAEHRKRYNYFCEYLAKNNYSSIVYDQRGHGETCGAVEKQGFMSKKDNFHVLVEDLKLVVDYAKENYPNQKIYILGHSMGSFIAQRYLQMYPNTTSGVILSGTNYTKSFLFSIGRLLANIVVMINGKKEQSYFLNNLSFGSYNNEFKPNRTKFDWLSTDTNVVDLYIKDPYCGYVFSSSYYRDILKGFSKISKSYEMISKDESIYLFSGEKDPVGSDGKGVYKVYDDLKNICNVKDVTIKIYQNMRHETLNEINREGVYKDLIKWLDLH